MSEESIAAGEKMACAAREVRQRERVYPRLVAQGRMSAKKAAREIAVMRAIAADYEAAALKDRLL